MRGTKKAVTKKRWQLFHVFSVTVVLAGPLFDGIS